MLELEHTVSRLSGVKKNEDIKALSFAKFPGTHCPLFGVAMIASFLSDLAVLVVGTGECTYYAKGFAYGNQKGEDNFYSLVIGKHDLTFGCGSKVLHAVAQIREENRHGAIMVVTTCVLEVIGEDLESLLWDYGAEQKIPLLVVKTEHFKCGSHIPGMERSLSALAGLMHPAEKKREKSINLLGHRKHGVEHTEVMGALAREGVAICSIIPSSCKIAEIQKAAEAALNVVTDFTALPLAKEMERTLSIPYVYFGRHLMQEKIQAAYAQIEKILGIEILKHLEEQQKELSQLYQRARSILAGKSFIYGNTPMMAFAVSDYLCELGLVPLLIQVREYYASEQEDMRQILRRGWDPYIVQIANIAPMQAVYEELKPDIYLGHENPVALFQKGIVQVTADEVIEKIGFEVPIAFLNKILDIYEMARRNPDLPVGMMSMMGVTSGPKAGMQMGKNPGKHKLDLLLTALSGYTNLENQTSSKVCNSNGGET